MKFVAILLALSLSAGADEMVRPHSYEDFAPTPEQMQTHVFIPGAAVAFADYHALKRDFPKLRSMSDRDVDAWIVRNFSYLSLNQLDLRGVRSDDFQFDAHQTKTFLHPSLYFRAAVASTGADGEALVDLKGSGLAPESSMQMKSLLGRTSAAQRAKLEAAVATEDAQSRRFLMDKVRTKDHSDGLMSLGEAIAEVVRQKAVQSAFDIYNASHATSHQTVESYFVLSLPVKILKEGEAFVPAAIYGRQAHMGRHNGLKIPDGIYVDDAGLRQRSHADSAVDFGGVIITQTDLQATFGSPLETKTKYRRHDPLLSREWRYANDTAWAFWNHLNAGRINEGRFAINSHIDTMLGPLREKLSRLQPLSRRVAYVRYLQQRRDSKVVAPVADRVLGVRTVRCADLF